MNIEIQALALSPESIASQYCFIDDAALEQVGGGNMVANV